MNKRNIVAYSLVLTGIILTAGWIQLREPVRYTFQPESKLQLDGTSTVHDWTCNATQLTGFMEGEVTDDGLTVSAGQVTVPIEALDCGHKAMNGRLQSTMNAKEHPNVEYTLTSAEVVESPSSDSYRLETQGTVKINGVEKPVEMVLDAKRLSDGKIELTGSVPLKMTDFNMKPVTFLAIKTGDEVTVSFDVISSP